MATKGTEAEKSGSDIKRINKEGTKRGDQDMLTFPASVYTTTSS